MFKCKKILLFPSRSQAKKIDIQIEEHRQLYNRCLHLKKEAWVERKENLTCFDLIKSEVKKHKKHSNYSSLQQTVRRLDKAYSSFFRRVNKGEKSGFPRFKSKDRFRTIEYGSYGDGNKIKNDRVYLQNIGQIKCSTKAFPKNIKKLSITKIGDRYYANLLYEEVNLELVERTNNAIGIDFGLKTFVVTSDGEKFESPKFHRESLKNEAKIHRRIHKSKKGSKLREKHKKTLQKVKNKIANKRRDFNHKLSRKIVNRNDIIVIEDIALQKLTSNINNINRTYRDVAWGQFQTFLTYKAENAGKVVVKINPAYTTQECSCCGHIEKKLLNQREHICNNCGYKDDRDVNAAKNILRRGLASLGLDPRSP